MKKNYFFAVALAAAALTGCSQEEFADYNPEIKSDFTATLEAVGSRTTLDAANTVQWVKNDSVSLFEKVDINAKYQVSDIDSETGKATLEYVSHTPKTDYKTLDKYYAVYPYSANNTISATDGKITAPVPATYTYKDKESSIASALMVARSDTKDMTFTNAQGIIRLKLNALTPHTYGKIQSITLTSTAENVYLNGTATMSWEGTTTPSAVIGSGTETNKSLKINLDDLLKENLPAKQEDKYAEYYVPVVPTAFGKDKLEIFVAFADTSYTTTVPAPFTVGRKNIVTLTHTIGSGKFTADIEDEVVSDEISNEAQLMKALKAGGEYTLVADIALAESAKIVEGVTVNLDLNGKTITGTVARDADVIANNGNLTLSNGAVSSTSVNGGSAILNNGTLTLKEVKVNGASSETASNKYAAYAVNTAGANSKLTVNFRSRCYWRN